MNEITAPIFVVGHPRSGTTLLASMLGRHPDFASTPETQYLSQARYLLAQSRKQGPHALARAAMQSPLKYLITDPDEYENMLTRAADGRPLDERIVFSVALEHFRRAHGAHRVVEKTPWHLRGMDRLVSWFPDCRIVWIVRDGRACVRSLQKVKGAPNDARVLARQWARNMAFGRVLSEQAGDRLATVRYEDLIADPERELTRLCDHLGVALDPAMLDTSRGTNVIKPNETAHKTKVNTPVDASRAEAWRTELSARDLADMAPIMNETLAALGYPTEPVPATFETQRARLLGTAPAVHLQ
ncbi:MAG TPA: sulfotransferase, partial [Aliiroseovarius sp.]|nr:sulfotransferase [Aliiroseovarius sp.]